VSDGNTGPVSAIVTLDFAQVILRGLKNRKLKSSSSQFNGVVLKFCLEMRTLRNLWFVQF